MRVALLLFFGIASLYYERTAISQLMLAISRDVSLTKLEQGWLFSAFSWGYVVWMVPGGFLVRRYGGWRCFQVGVLLSAALCAALAFCSSFKSLFALRFLLGAAEAPVFPACAAIVAARFRVGHLARATASFDSGSYLGGAVVGAFLPATATTLGWRLPFLFAAIPAVVIVGLSFVFTRRSDATVESPSPIADARNISWFLFLDLRFLGAAVAFVAYNFCKGFFLTWLPVLLVEGRGYNVLWTTVISATPFALAIGAEFASAHILDALDLRGDRRWVNRQRILFAGLIIASVVGVVGLYESRLFCLLVMIVCFCGLISVSPVLWSIPRELVEKMSDVGVAGGFLNFVSNVGGIASALLIGGMLHKGNSFDQVAVMLSGASLFGAVASFGLLHRAIRR